MHIPQRETRVIAESLLELLAVVRPSTAHNCVALRVRARKSYHLPFSSCPSSPPPHPSQTQTTRKLSCNNIGAVAGWLDIFRMKLRGSARVARTKLPFPLSRRFSWLLLSAVVNRRRYNGTLQRARALDANVRARALTYGSLMTTTILYTIG